MTNAISSLPVTMTDTPIMTGVLMDILQDKDRIRWIRWQDALCASRIANIKGSETVGFCSPSASSDRLIVSSVNIEDLKGNLR